MADFVYFARSQRMLGLYLLQSTLVCCISSHKQLDIRRDDLIAGQQWWCCRSDGTVGSWAVYRLEIVLEAPSIPEPLQRRAPICKEQS